MAHNIVHQQEDDMVFRGATLHYRTYGTGAQIALAFHGYGQESSHFQPLAEKMQQDYTLYSFDLFYHGKSRWRDTRQVLKPEEWMAMIAHFLAQKRIERFSLFGYSMGARFALALVKPFAASIDKVVLIAPDGIKTSFWYRLTTGPSVIRWIFRKTITQPTYFLQFSKTLHRVGLVDSGLVKFARHQMNTQEKRYRVYHSWTVLRKIRPSLDTLAQMLNQHNIPVLLFSGQYDRIIKTENLDRLSRRLKNCKTIELTSGHNHLIAAVADYCAAQR